MEARTIVPGSAVWRAVKKLYRTAFPPEQRYSPAALWLTCALRRPATLLAWFEDGVFCGMSCTVDTGVP